MPNLVAEKDEGFQPSSILLLLAGTGIVALPQIIAHRDPTRLLGIPTPRRKQLAQCPIDIIVSCREDDLLLLEQIRDWCLEGEETNHATAEQRKSRRFRYKGVRNCTLLMTPAPPASAKDVPFPDYYKSDEKNKHGDILQQLQDEIKNVTIRSQRLDKDLVAESIGQMVEPCHVLISGPDSFNQSARELLEECAFATLTNLTVLSA